MHRRRPCDGKVVGCVRIRLHAVLFYRSLPPNRFTFSYNFVWLPYSPWWALMVIGIDVLIIWALASYLRQPDVKSTEPAKTPQTTS
jgi:hypothetical protein